MHTLIDITRQGSAMVNQNVLLNSHILEDRLARSERACRNLWDLPTDEPVLELMRKGLY